MKNLILRRFAAFSYLITSSFICGISMMLPFSSELFFSWIPFFLYPLTVLILATSDLMMDWVIKCLFEEPKTK